MREKYKNLTPRCTVVDKKHCGGRYVREPIALAFLGLHRLDERDKSGSAEVRQVE